MKRRVPLLDEAIEFFSLERQSATIVFSRAVLPHRCAPSCIGGGVLPGFKAQQIQLSTFPGFPGQGTARTRVRAFAEPDVWLVATGSDLTCWPILGLVES